MAGWKGRTLSERFWEKVDDSGDCWLWTGSKIPTGYGHIGYKGKLLKAHRLSYEMHYDVDPGALCVCHTCDNPSCVNPDHLWLGTHQENMADRDSKSRRKVKLTAEDVAGIRLGIGAGFRLSALAYAYGVSTSTISDIKHGRTWKQPPAS